MTPIDDRPTLAEILAACLAVQAIYAARDAAAAASAQAAAIAANVHKRPHLADALELEPADP